VTYLRPSVKLDGGRVILVLAPHTHTANWGVLSRDEGTHARDRRINEAPETLGTRGEKAKKTAGEDAALFYSHASGTGYT
jgi:hypothetical protein